MTGASAPADARLAWRAPAAPWLAAGAVALAAAVGALSALVGPIVVVATGALGVAAAVAAHPPLAAYALLAATPLVVGIDRGAVVPLMRPNEALAILLGGTLACRALLLHVAGRRRLRLRISALDAALLLLAGAGSIVPLLWLAARGLPLTEEDLLHALPLWKYYGVFLLIRASVRDASDVGVSLWVTMSAGAAVAVIGILQALDLLGVTGLLATHWTPEMDVDALTENRATSTLASPLAMGDLMTFNLAIAFGWLLRGGRRRGALTALSVVFVLGTLASGQFSALVGLAAGAAALAAVTGRWRAVALSGLIGGAVGGLAVYPVVIRRLAGFDSIHGLPQSWVGRWENLRTFFWPELATPEHLMLGVRPAARIRAVESWRDYIWIESGYTWLVWTGGALMLVAFAGFAWLALAWTARIARARADAIGAAATASFVSLAVVTTLMIFDVHLTLRGGADLLFALLALACVDAPGARSGAEDEPLDRPLSALP